MKKCYAIPLVALLAATAAAHACRYTVRDVGFADLGNERYTFFCFVDGQVSTERAKQLGQAAGALLGDSNVRFEWVNLAEGNHPQAKRLAKQEPGVPAGLLLSPDGELAWPVTFPAAKPDNPEWSFLASVVSSPTRDELIKKMIPAYAVVLFVEGTDPAQTRRARVAVGDAIKAITPLLPQMPKPVDHPPEMVVLPPQRVAEESVLLWSLGLDVEPVPEPQAVVLMGRGRRVGQPLRGGLVTRTALQESLAVVGQDCECGLDRVWMQGERFPLSWGRTEKVAAFKELGFDPDNPQVKAEISRIITRGPNSRPGGVTQTASSNFDQLALGYSEELIEIETEPLVQAELPTLKEVTMEPKTDPKPESVEPESVEPESVEPESVEPESAVLGQARTIWWSLAVIAAVTLAGGGLLLLRRAGN